VPTDGKGLCALQVIVDEEVAHGEATFKAKSRTTTMRRATGGRDINVPTTPSTCLSGAEVNGTQVV
jgi:hypothetical protein